jgi:hypothetical protein
MFVALAAENHCQVMHRVLSLDAVKHEEHLQKHHVAAPMPVSHLAYDNNTSESTVLLTYSRTVYSYTETALCNL